MLKWAGGKTQLLGEILQRLPTSIDTYFEPFLGGGAVFFALSAAGRFRRAVLSDRNPDLVGVYRALQVDVEAVIRALRRFKYDEESYYGIRASNPRTLATRAARLIYLNKTGYNGLYRVNSSGTFNVPFGRYKNPRICDEPALRAASAALRDVELREADFDEVCAEAKAGDAVYFDPPYLPLSRTSSFTAYDRHPFGIAEHERLAATFASLGERGVYALLSNSDTPTTRALYESFRPASVLMARPISSKGSARGKVSELLVQNTGS